MCILGCAGMVFIGTSAKLDAKTFYLDAQISQTCQNNYSIQNRDCSGNDGLAFNDLRDALGNLQGGDTLFIRNGTYSKPHTGDYREGALAINVSGNAAQPTTVSAYPGEQPIICADINKPHYNPNPGDTSFHNSSKYYPNPAISVGAAFVKVYGLKTFGQVYINGNDVLVENCDLGGGGPVINQGNVVLLYGHNLTIRNNKIHNSCWGESDINGSAVMGYNFSAIIENNEFYDNWGSDIRLKDTGGQIGRATHIRNNFFKPSAYSNCVGVRGIAQDGQIDYVYISNNIFFEKVVAIEWDGGALKGTTAHNNTFINCGKDISTWRKNKIYAFNNLHYSSKNGQRYYDIQADPLSNLASDYNLFYSTTGDKSFYNLYKKKGSSLGAWRSYSGKDAASISTNPNFVNPNGNNPQDFKRQNYTGEVSSPYGVMTGAYQTGNEIIGVDPNLPPVSHTPPPNPTPVPGTPPNVAIIIN